METKLSLEQLRKEKLKGSILRSKANWIEHGEKPSRYFCSLEKRNYINKTVVEIIDDQGNKITEQNKLLDEIKDFYTKLYTSRDKFLNDVDLNKELESIDIPKLDKNESEPLEGLIEYKEASSVLSNMKNNKSPGPDGFTTEFFLIFLEGYRTLCCKIL